MFRKLTPVLALAAGLAGGLLSRYIAPPAVHAQAPAPPQVSAPRENSSAELHAGGRQRRGGRDFPACAPALVREATRNRAGRPVRASDLERRRIPGSPGVAVGGEALIRAHRHPAMIDQDGSSRGEVSVGAAVDDGFFIADDDLRIAARHVTVAVRSGLRRSDAETVAVGHDDRV